MLSKSKNFNFLKIRTPERTTETNAFVTVIAAIAGVGGTSSSLVWMEPFRPYLIGITIIAIGYAWYAFVKLKSKDDCECAVEKTKFFQSRRFLIGMTVFAAIGLRRRV